MTTVIVDKEVLCGLIDDLVTAAIEESWIGSKRPEEHLYIEISLKDAKENLQTYLSIPYLKIRPNCL